MKQINKVRIKLTQEEFNAAEGCIPCQSTKFNNTGKPIPHKWRAPEESQQNKRIIDNKPYTYNPTIKGWVLNNTPSDCLPSIGANLTSQTENKPLKTDCDTPEKSANYRPTFWFDCKTTNKRVHYY